LNSAGTHGPRHGGPAQQHNPYTKDGRSELHAAKLVVVLPFEKTNVQRIRLSMLP
jgi:hypothetical protein